MTNINDPSLRSWIEVSEDNNFPIQNIPFGIFCTNEKSPRVATAIGDYILDLATLAELGYFNTIPFDKQVFHQTYLNDFIALGKPITNAVRARISDLLNINNNTLRDNEEDKTKVLHSISSVQLLMPVKVGDYTDFYSSREHATNLGKMFRDPENALLPNWLHLPVGYHGRASSIVVSGTPTIRPKGQQFPKGAATPVFGKSKLLDFELEMGFIVGKKTDLGASVSTQQAEEHIFGLVLFNDWSARDIQKWEYVPLGPFLGKSFASTISPWVVTLEALAPFKVDSPVQDPEVLPYLKFEGKKNYDIHLEIELQTAHGGSKVISRSNFKYMYWNMCQQLAHHTINGCNINVGDICASGTISGPEPGSYGSMLEICWQGTKPISMPDGTERTFLQDGDTVIMRGFSKGDGYTIGFGGVESKIAPAIKHEL